MPLSQHDSKLLCRRRSPAESAPSFVDKKRTMHMEKKYTETTRNPSHMIPQSPSPPVVGATSQHQSQKLRRSRAVAPRTPRTAPSPPTAGFPRRLTWAQRADASRGGRPPLTTRHPSTTTRFSNHRRSRLSPEPATSSHAAPVTHRRKEGAATDPNSKASVRAMLRCERTCVPSWSLCKDDTTIHFHGVAFQPARARI